MEKKENMTGKERDGDADLHLYSPTAEAKGKTEHLLLSSSVSFNVHWWILVHVYLSVLREKALPFQYSVLYANDKHCTRHRHT